MSNSLSTSMKLEDSITSDGRVASAASHTGPMKTDSTITLLKTG